MRKLTVFAAPIVIVMVLCCYSCGRDQTPRQAEPAPGKLHSSEQPREKVQDLIAQIQKSMKENFGTPGYQTSWYSSILRLEINGATLIAYTSLDLGDPRISGVCGALSGFVFSSFGQQNALTEAKVIGASGQILVHRRSVADSCQP